MRKSYRLDISILKTVGLFGVILAHFQNVPDWVMQLRCFDVPLLCFVSGVLVSNNKIGNIKDFYLKRIKRLVIPTYLFIAFYFLMAIISGNWKGLGGIKALVNSLLFQREGIMGVWIISIYIGCTLLTPLFLRICNNDYTLILSYFIVAVCIYEILVRYFYDESNQFLRTFFLIIGFSFCYFGGMFVDRMSGKFIVIGGGISMIVYIIFAINLYMNNNYYVLTSEFKYPPRIYYLSYGFLCIFVMYYLLKKYNGKYNLKNSKFVVAVNWISGNSLWIFLWHIFIKVFMAHYVGDIWAVQYIFVLFMSCCIVLVQHLIIDRIDIITSSRFKFLTNYFRG